MSREPRSFGPAFFDKPASVELVVGEPAPPPRPLSWKKDAPIQVFVTTEFRQEVNATAHDDRITMSEFVRRALTHYMARRGEGGAT